MVAWSPLAEPAPARDELDRLVGVPKLSGARCLVAHDPLDWLARRNVRAVFGELAERGLAWDVVAVTPALGLGGEERVAVLGGTARRWHRC